MSSANKENKKPFNAKSEGNGACDKFPCLKFNPSGLSNLREWLDESSIYSTATLGTVAKVIKTGLLPLRSEPDIPERILTPVRESEATFNQRMINYNSDRKAVIKLNEEIKSNADRLFGILYGNTNRLSRERAAQFPMMAYAVGTQGYVALAEGVEAAAIDDWDEVVATLDVERLIQRLVASHQGV